MKTITILLFLCVTVTIQSQSIDTSVISNSGGTDSNSAHIITFTIGEIFIGTISDSQSVEQGFWSGIASQNILSTEEIQPDDRAIVVYPNPVSDFFTIRIPDIGNYDISLFNIHGQKILSQKINTSQQGDRIDISSLSQGIYTLLLSITETGANKTFKIMKK